MSDDLTVEVRAELASLTLSVSGELDLSTVGILRTCLEHIDPKVRTVVVDLADLTFLDSTGLNLLVHTHQRFGPELRELLITNPQGAVRRVLELSGVGQLISVSDRMLDATVREPA